MSGKTIAARARIVPKAGEVRGGGTEVADTVFRIVSAASEESSDVRPSEQVATTLIRQLCPSARTVVSRVKEVLFNPQAVPIQDTPPSWE